MFVETKQMVPITKLQKQLTQTVRSLSDSGEAVYILKNNNMEAVLLSYQEYEHLKEIEEIFEHFEIKNIVDTRIEKSAIVHKYWAYLKDNYKGKIIKKKIDGKHFHIAEKYQTRPKEMPEDVADAILSHQ